MNQNRLHRWIAFPLALAMIVSLATPVFAAESAESGISSSYDETSAPTDPSAPDATESEQKTESTEETEVDVPTEPDDQADVPAEEVTQETAATEATDFEEKIAPDYDALEGEVHNTVDASQLLPEQNPEDSPVPFASYSYATELAKFPADYQTLLKKLHEKHPDWVFVAEKTGISFSTAVAKESNNSLSYISPSACSSLMSSSVNSTYANSNTVAYYMDPRNYLTEKGIFLFADIANSGNYTEAGVEAVISGTNLSNSKTYYKKSNVAATLPDTYAKTMLKAGSTYDMNPYFIGAKIITETGGSLKQTSISGQNSTYPNIYNFYNIGAYTGAVDGLKWASQGSSYSRPWNTPTKSINGGASMIYSNYVTQGQNTVYYTRFNTSPNAKYGHYTHQYMSSLYGAINEAERMYKGYAKSGGKCVFFIPVYQNMPSTNSVVSLSGALKGVSFTKTTKAAKTSASVKMRTGPSSSYDDVLTVPAGATLTITGGVATNNSTKSYQIVNPYWFKATYNGTSGYVSAELVQPSSSYTVARGKTKTLPYTLANAKDPVYFLSSDTSTATVSSTGVVTGVKNGSCTIYAFSGGGFDAVGVTVSNSTSTKVTTLTTSNATLSLSYTTKPYTGSALKPATTVKYGSKKLTNGEDYTVSYSNNKEPGTATVKITGTGDYKGSLSKTFKITALTAVYRTTSKVNYRSGCGTDATLKGSIAANKPVQVVYGWYKMVDGAPWYKVLISGTYYYMSGNYLKQEVLVNYRVKSNVNYRTGCGTSYTKKGQFKKGAIISIVKGWNKKVDGNTWFRVKSGGQYYYVMASYLTKGETLLQYHVQKNVNVRSDAGTTKTLKAYLMKDTPVTVVKGGSKTVSGAAWYRIKIDEKYYYIMASYLSQT